MIFVSTNLVNKLTLNCHNHANTFDTINVHGMGINLFFCASPCDNLPHSGTGFFDKVSREGVQNRRVPSLSRDTNFFCGNRDKLFTITF